MIDFDELTEEQRMCLKRQMLVDSQESVSYGELAMADELVSDEELEDMYGGTVFTEDDFWG